jgi:prevent-host-death family protein
MRTYVLAMNSNVKGAVAEQAIVLAAMKLRIPVLRPVDEHGRCDLALDVADRLWRVQCKWGSLSSGQDVVVVQLGTSRLTPRGYVRTVYTEKDVDLFGVYCGELNRCFLIPLARVGGQKQLHLRLTAARNGQRSCITLAEDFDFEGAIAQLGERCHGMAEVAGSSPASSTSQGQSPTLVGSNPFRDRLGYWMDRVAAGDEIVITRHGKPRIRLSPAVTRQQSD